MEEWLRVGLFTMNRILYILAMCALLVSCSETSSVPADEKLFTGLRTTVYDNYTPGDHFSAVKEEVEAALATAPKCFSNSRRTLQDKVAFSFKKIY